MFGMRDNWWLRRCLVEMCKGSLTFFVPFEVFHVCLNEQWNDNFWFSAGQLFNLEYQWRSSNNSDRSDNHFVDVQQFFKPSFDCAYFSRAYSPSCEYIDRRGILISARLWSYLDAF